jgi:hypothetical protein
MVPDGSFTTRHAGGTARPSPGRGRRLALRNERRNRDRASKSNGRPDSRGGRPRRRRSDARTLGAHRHRFRLEANDNRAVAIGPQDTGAGPRQAIERDPCRVTVRIAVSSRRDGNSRPHRVDERLGRGCPAAVMGNLEQVDMRKSGGEELWVDGLFDVAHQQEPSGPDLSEKDDGHVVDTRAAIGRLDRDLATSRPEGPKDDLVDGQAVARCDRRADRRAGTGQLGKPGAIPRTGSTHARLHYALDAIPLEQQGETGDVILVRVREDD